MQSKVYRLLFLFIFYSSLESQVNTESMRYGSNESLFKQTFDIGFDLEQASSKISNSSFSYRLDYTGLKKLSSFFILSYSNSYLEKDNRKDIISNKGFAHGRSTYQLYDDFFFGEIFLQKEFNDFIFIKDRQLVGSVLRLKLSQSYHLYLGLGIMSEKEVYEFDPTKDLIRSTNYLSGSMNIMENIIFNNIIYFQFDLSNTNDYRVLLDSMIDFTVNENISISCVVNYRFDNDQHENLSKYYYILSNNLSVSF
ncbi:MAG: hypothetical protein CBD58_04515 [bacterium TMED198]|nr:MAG: hypothetical protein CBD58_04515 [bacterium TMED198]